MIKIRVSGPKEEVVKLWSPIDPEDENVIFCSKLLVCPHDFNLVYFDLELKNVKANE